MAPQEVKAFEGYKAKAEKGDVDAQYKLGNYYLEGIGVARDFPKAVSWYRKAAELGDARAQYSLGKCYITHPLSPLGGVECFEEEVKFSRIVEKYPRVKVSPKDQRPGFALDLEYFTGIMLEYSRELEAAAVKWYRKAADQGHAEAQYSLGKCYANGKGVTKDEVEAVKWYRKSADQGYAEAQYNLGVCYDNGEGVLKDEIEAYAYCNLAGITSEIALKNLAILEKKLPPEARVRGQQRSKELQKEIEAKIASMKAGK
jgi:TPR repeat protein